MSQWIHCNETHSWYLELNSLYSDIACFENCRPLFCNLFVKWASYIVHMLWLRCSAVENVPPVVLTDEEICLEVVERSDSWCIIDHNFRLSHISRATTMDSVISTHTSVWWVCHNVALNSRVSVMPVTFCISSVRYFVLTVRNDGVWFVYYICGWTVACRVSVVMSKWGNTAADSSHFICLWEAVRPVVGLLMPHWWSCWML